MKKNIVFILADQLRADFLSCYGAKYIDTPNIDSLCENGFLYKRALSHNPICVPARASLLTGKNALVNGVMDNFHWLRKDRLECGIKTWPEKLKKEGYHTEAIGKMHFYPWDTNEGFDHRVIAEDKRQIFIEDDYHEYLTQFDLRRYHVSEHEGWQENKGAVISRIPLEHQVDKYVADKTCDFISTHSTDNPFAVMVGFPGPHCPYDPPQEYLDMFDEKDMPDSIPETQDSKQFREGFIRSMKNSWNGVDYTEFTQKQKKKVRAHYAALVKQIDDGVGNIIKSLKDKGIYDNTVIIFSADHGDFVGDFSFVCKSHFYESSIRVPLVVHDPDVSKKIVYDNVVSLTDIYSSILNYAEVEVEENSDSMILPRDLNVDGRKYVFGVNPVGYMIAEDRWKLIKYRSGVTMLFDLENDKNEQKNLAEDINYSDVKNRLDAMMLNEIVQSTKNANNDKFVNKTSDIEYHIGGAGDFGRRNWEWEYPNCDC
jgi:arylsulfatase